MILPEVNHERSVREAFMRPEVSAGEGKRLLAWCNAHSCFSPLSAAFFWAELRGPDYVTTLSDTIKTYGEQSSLRPNDVEYGPIGSLLRHLYYPKPNLSVWADPLVLPQLQTTLHRCAMFHPATAKIVASMLRAPPPTIVLLPATVAIDDNVVQERIADLILSRTLPIRELSTLVRAFRTCPVPLNLDQSIQERYREHAYRSERKLALLRSAPSLLQRVHQWGAQRSLWSEIARLRIEILLCRTALAA